MSTPGEKSGTYYDETELEKSSVTLYRSCVMRLAYLSADLPHLQFCANRLARNGQADGRPLEPFEESCAVSEGAWSLGSRIPSSGSDEHD